MKDEDKEINNLPVNVTSLARKRAKYTIALAEEICLLVAEGHSLREIGNMPDMPSFRTICRWQYEHPDFREHIGIFKWIHAQDAAEQAVEAIRDVDLEAEDAGLRLRKAEALARTLLGRAKLLESKNNPFKGEE
ncbi:hypothetical protein BM716_000237 [Escherichia coli]|nr:hypothetical protein [Escherichia coli]EFG5121799.1 hypothetical protein [Escherichia coli]